MTNDRLNVKIVLIHNTVHYFKIWMFQTDLGIFHLSYFIESYLLDYKKIYEMFFIMNNSLSVLLKSKL